MTVSEALQAAAAQRQTGNLQGAERLYREVLALDPRHAEAHFQLGCVLKSQRRFAEALRSFEQAVTLQPRLAEAYFEAATIYHGASRNRTDEASRRRDTDAAEQAYRAAVAARPDYFEAYNNLGAIYRHQGKPQAAIECYQRVLGLRPDFAEARANMGMALVALGRELEALACYDEALRWRGDDPELHRTRGLALLTLGRYREGWQECEWRWRCAEFQPLPHTLPRWDGGPLHGRTLLVHAEQGFGDTLQYVRYVPRLAQFGGRIVVEAQPPLVSLLRHSRVAEVFADGGPLPPCDVWVPTMSLPGAFDTTEETIPRDVPYLSAAPELVARWRDELPATDGLRVAVAWQSGVVRGYHQFRSIRLAELEPLARVPGVQLISVQVGAGAEQIARVAADWPLVDVGRRLTDFHDSAAVLSNVDLVISCDTAVAHLAGALAKPTWVALPFAADWRWSKNRDGSLWYPTARLFRQSVAGAWADVFGRMATALRELAHSRRAASSFPQQPAP